MPSAADQATTYALALHPPSKDRLPKAPYPGLRSFRMDEWPIFFGREIATENVLNQLDETPFVMVHGSSGCGKSSLIFAGVLPRMNTRAQQRGIGLATALMRPGSTPLTALAAALAAGLDRKGDETQIYRLLNRGRDAGPDIREYISKAGFKDFCLYIDQFEELFRLSEDESEAALFVEVLVGLSGIRTAEQPWWRPAPAPRRRRARKAGMMQIIATMRSEFFGDCARFEELAELVNHTQYLLPPMREGDLERAIRDPAELYGRGVERQLARELIDEAAQESDPLPLIQHALMLMWEKNPAKLTTETYRTLAVADPSSRKKADPSASKTDLGRVFANHVDRVVDSHGAHGDVAEILIRALVNIDTQRRATRRPQSLTALIELVGPKDEQALLSLIDEMRAEGASFLRPFQRDDPSPLSPETMIDISHEALFRAWPRAADPSLDPDTNQPKGWLQREYEDGLIWRALAVQARAHKLNPEELLDAAATPRHAEWFKRIGSRAAWAERYLIEPVHGPAADQQPEWLSVRLLIEESELKVAAAKREADLKVQKEKEEADLKILKEKEENEAAATKRRQATTRKWIQWTTTIAGLLLIVVGLIFDQTVRARSAAVQAQERAQARAKALKAKLDEVETRISQQAVYISLGSDERPRVLSANTGNKVKPSTLQDGDRVRVIEDAMIRAGVPGDNYTLAPGRGFLKHNSTVTITATPVIVYRGQEAQYWARIQGSAITFGALHFYYTGDDPPGTREEFSTDARARRMALGLINQGFRVSITQRDSRVAGKSEIHFFRQADVDQAQFLSTTVFYMTGKGGLAKSAALPRIRELDNGGDATQRKPLEVWIDLGTSEVPTPPRHTKPPVATSPDLVPPVGTPTPTEPAPSEPRPGEQGAPKP